MGWGGVGWGGVGWGGSMVGACCHRAHLFVVRDGCCRISKGTHAEFNFGGKLVGSPGSSTYSRGRFVCEVEWLCPVGHYCPLDHKSKVSCVRMVSRTCRVCLPSAALFHTTNAPLLHTTFFNRNPCLAHCHLLHTHTHP